MEETPDAMDSTLQRDTGFHPVASARERINIAESGSMKPPFLMAADSQKESSKHAIRSIAGACMLYTVLAFPAVFSSIGLYIAVYMRQVGGDRSVEYYSVSLLFLLSIIFQSIGAMFTSPLVAAMGERKLSLLGCLGVTLCIMGSAHYLHNYYAFMLLYSVLGGTLSGLAMSVPVDAVLKLNSKRRGLSCGILHGVVGMALTFMGPLYVSYINGKPPRLTWNGSINQLQSGKAGNNIMKHLMDKAVLQRAKSVILYTAVFYLILTIFGLRWTFANADDSEEAITEKHSSEYEPFVAKGESRKSENDPRRNVGWWEYISLWLLSLLAWQALLYIHAHWRNHAVNVYKASATDMVKAELVVRGSSLIGRIAWGMAIDTYGWKVTWTSFSIATLIITIAMKEVYHNSFVLYVMWVAMVYFTYSGVFCIVPLAAHQIFGSQSFIQVFSTLSTSRAIAGSIAFFFSITMRSYEHWILGYISILSVSSLLVVTLIDE
ncbi:hypothetical protein BgAZ_403120 [Babesia gibsoni]|uniref:Membrane transporter n=1 Tax=Babesia gibsoni TaxID=33632 RepID=A0AAD8LIM8_BABGI|nr:hypothetical protein BgAZ_403120 [Babesia gibsoni]